MFLQLKVVVWKNLIIRKRHWILTIFESLLPILLFLLIAYARSKIGGLNKREVVSVTYNEFQPIRYDSLGVDETRLYYTPNNEFYQDIVKRIQVKLQMYNNNIKGFDSSQALQQYYNTHHNGTVIAIIFNGNDEKNLEYTIRYHNGYQTRYLNTAQMYKNQFQFIPGVIGSEYFHRGLLSIQRALDMSYIEKLSGKDGLDANVTIGIQEFPYPPHKEDSAIHVMFITYLPLITLFSFIFLCPAVLKRVVEEKYTGIKELMKMVGMKSWMLWLGWFIYGMIPVLFSVICIVILMKVPFFGTEYPPIEYTDGTVLFTFLLLYCMAAIAFCFFISSLFNKPTIAMVIGLLIWILSYFIPTYSFGLDESNHNLSRSYGILLNLLPNMALHYGYSAISIYEERELGLQWNNFCKSGSGGIDDVTMLNVLVMLLIDVIFYVTLTFYMDGVNPGKYGARKSLLFPVFSLIKFIRKYFTEWDSHAEPESVRLGNVEEGRGMKKGIEIQNLSKRYKNKLAVNDLTLDIYQNQITVLLGHNGAGKSTTMSMITGMIDITSGNIKMNGINIRGNMDKIRKDLGLCPQHNLLFTDLTVGEHLEFFARLKGKSAKEAREEMKLLLVKLNLLEKKNAMANTLSGGMKRKLCLGMAIIGGSNILILDEPTSGMDPESRRELWDLLQSWRGEKTILITTHFMEEADALGDWIAIMSNGTLQCYGTPMYLKKQYDTGYHLSLMVNGSATKEDLDKIKTNILTHVLNAQFKGSNGNNLIFVLPFEENMTIAELLSSLEEKKHDLKIENISITVTTLEDVFLKAKLENETESENNISIDSEDMEGITHTPKKLLTLRVIALMKKKLQFYQKKCFTYIIPAFIAIIFFVLTIYLSGQGSDYYGDNGPKIKFDLSTYKETLAFYNGTQVERVEKMKNAYQQMVENSRGSAKNVMDVQQAIIDKAIENIVYFKEHMIASAEFVFTDEVTATALYNAIAVHSSPISLNLITNAIAKAYLGVEYSISASYWPLETISQISSPQDFSEVKVGILWLILIPTGCLFILGSFIAFTHIELSTKFAQLQYMCGVKPYYYWLVNFFADLMVYVIIAMILVILMTLGTPFINKVEFGALFLILLMYGVAGIPFAYLFSRMKSASAAFALFIISGIILGIVLTVVVGVLTESGDSYYIEMGDTLKVIFMIFLPQFGLAYSGVAFSRKAVSNYNLGVMDPTKSRSRCSYDPDPCCIKNSTACENFKSYWPLLDENFGLMVASFFLYFVINILLDSYIVKKFWSKCHYEVTNVWYRLAETNLSPDNTNPKSDYNTLKAKNLHKTYAGKQIVRNIDFSLKDGECLGILGVNGAGKTTTFRMLTREEIGDQGSVQIEDNGRFFDLDHDEYLEKLGYCPQADALNFVLTGRQILSLIAHLRGVNNPQIVNLFLKIFELEKYADMPCGYYSGGNKRKLSLAVALIGYPKCVLLDEPTNGVDPSSRRKFWTLIKKVQEKKKLSFILTSHSMVECEALCNNLKIMKDGRFEKEGTISDLKKEFGGFSIKLKLTNRERSSPKREIENDDNSATKINIESYDDVDSIPSIVNENEKFDTVDELKKHFIRKYGGEIKDEHSGLLHFYIKDKNKKWSTIFKEVEHIKMQNNHLIEDYAISEASLEDIFLSVARSEESNTEGRPKKNKIKKFKKKGGTSTI